VILAAAERELGLFAFVFTLELKEQYETDIRRADCLKLTNRPHAK